MASISDMILMSGGMSPWAGLQRGLSSGIGTASNLQNLYGQALQNRYNQQRAKQAAIQTQYMPQMQQAGISKLNREAMTIPTRFSAFQDYSTGRTFVLDKSTGGLMTPAQAYQRGWRGFGGTAPQQQAGGGQPGTLASVIPPGAGGQNLAPPPYLAAPQQTGPMSQAVSQDGSNPFLPPPGGSDITLNPYTVGVRSKRGAQYSIKNPDGTITVASSPTQASQTFAQKRNAALAEIDTLKNNIDTHLRPYSGISGLSQAALQKDIADYSISKDPKILDKLANYWAIKQIAHPVATLYARGESGGAPTDQAIGGFKDAIYRGSADIPFNMPQNVVVEGRKRSREMQRKMIRAANIAYAQGFPTVMPEGTQTQRGIVLPPSGAAPSPAQAMEQSALSAPTPTQAAPQEATGAVPIPEFPSDQAKKDWFANLSPSQRKQVIAQLGGK